VDVEGEIVDVEGYPKSLEGQRLHYRIQAPAFAVLEGRIGSEPFSLGRMRDELWLVRPDQGTLWRARSSLDDPLEPLAWPFLGVVSEHLSDLFVVSAQPNARIGDVRCLVLRGQAGRSGSTWLPWLKVRVTLWLAESDQHLRQIQVDFPDRRRSITVYLRSLRVLSSEQGATWRVPRLPGVPPEKVPVARIRGAFPDGFHELGILNLVAP
jgi:hypothetical protein